MSPGPTSQKRGLEGGSGEQGSLACLQRKTGSEEKESLSGSAGVEVGLISVHPSWEAKPRVYLFCYSNFYFIFLSFFSPISFFLFSLLFFSLSFLLLSCFPFLPSSLFSLPSSLLFFFLCFPPSLLFLCLWGSHSVDCAVLKFLVILLLQPSKNWDYRHVQL